MEQFSGRWNRVSINVRPTDHAFAIDDENRSLRLTSRLVKDVERFDHFTMRPEIASNWERHLASFVAAIFFHTLSPSFLNRNRISADLDDLSVQSDELGVACAEPAHLVQSATGEAGGMKPNNHCFASKI